MITPVTVTAPIVFFTGAGISVSAGLPTYRGTGGLYTNSDLEPPHARDITPERLPLLWDRFRDRLAAAQELQPTAAHRHIATLESELAGSVTVVTQNVDGLHRAAGSSHVIELHGTLARVRCVDADHDHALADITWSEAAPLCPTCGSVCRPGVVLFGEALPSDAWEQAMQAMRQAVTVVAVGTSAEVYPAAHLIDTGLNPEATRLWINPETPPPSSDWLWMRGDSDTQVGTLRASV